MTIASLSIRVKTLDGRAFSFDGQIYYRRRSIEVHDPRRIDVTLYIHDQIRLVHDGKHQLIGSSSVDDNLLFSYGVQDGSTI